MACEVLLAVWEEVGEQEGSAGEKMVGQEEERKTCGRAGCCV